VIESGDSLSKIAKKYYQDALQYPRIFEANKEVIKDADLIYPGLAAGQYTLVISNCHVQTCYLDQKNYTVRVN
jgi:nucleoid-associated protein YgaU